MRLFLLLCPLWAFASVDSLSPVQFTAEISIFEGYTNVNTSAFGDIRVKDMDVIVRSYVDKSPDNILVESRFRIKDIVLSDSCTQFVCVDQQGKDAYLKVWRGLAYENLGFTIHRPAYNETRILFFNTKSLMAYDNRNNQVLQTFER